MYGAQVGGQYSAGQAYQQQPNYGMYAPYGAAPPPPPPSSAAPPPPPPPPQ